MLLAHRLSRRVEVLFDNKAWRLLFTNSVLLDVQDLTGLDVFAGQINMYRPAARVFRAVLYAGLRAAGSNCTLTQVGKWIQFGSIATLRNTVYDAWLASMPDPEKVERVDSEVPTFTWMDAWAIARYSLNLTEREWLDMTPRMVHILNLQRLESLRQTEFLFSRLTATTANFSFGAPKDPFKDDRFMLHPWPRKLVEPTPVTGEMLMNMFSPLRAKDSKIK